MQNESNIFSIMNECLNETFSKTIYCNWRKYLDRIPGLGQETSWMFFSDYCLCDKTKHNDCFSFTMCPTRFFERIVEDIDLNIPRDIKKTTYISEKTLEYLKHPYFFNLSFIYDNVKSFNNVLKTDNKQILQKYLKQDIKNLSEKNNLTEFEKDFLKKLKKLYENSKANNFNTLIYTKLILIAFFASYTAMFLTKNLKLEKLIWLSDRGNVFNFNDEICLDYYNQIYHNLWYSVSSLLPKPEPFGIAIDSDLPSKTWYDSLLKFPDYSAGTIASWDLSANEADKDKHVKIIERVIAENDNFNIIKISQTAQLHTAGFLEVKLLKKHNIGLI